MNDLFNRMGKFKISRPLIESNPEGVIEALKDVLIVKVDNDFMINTLIYAGYSKHFDILEPGEIAPNYIVGIDENKNVCWQREKEYTERDVKSMFEEILKRFK